MDHPGSGNPGDLGWPSVTLTHGRMLCILGCRFRVWLIVAKMSYKKICRNDTIINHVCCVCVTLTLEQPRMFHRYHWTRIIILCPPPAPARCTLLYLPQYKRRLKEQRTNILFTWRTNWNNTTSADAFKQEKRVLRENQSNFHPFQSYHSWPEWIHPSFLSDGAAG